MSQQNKRNEAQNIDKTKLENGSNRMETPREAAAGDKAAGVKTSEESSAAPADIVVRGPIFYDEEAGRWRWFLRLAMPVALVAVAALLLLGASLLARPLMPPTMLPRVSETRDFGAPDPILDEHGRRPEKIPPRPLSYLQRRELGFKQRQDKERLAKLDAAEQDMGQSTPFEPALTDKRSQMSNLLTGAIPYSLPPADASKVVAGFYVSWDESSRASTRRNIAALTHFIPEWLHLKAAGALYAAPTQQPFLDARQPQDIKEVQPFVQKNHVPILALLNNFTKKGRGEEGEGQWDVPALHQIVSNSAARANLITHLRQWLLARKLQGVNIDFEQVAQEDRDNLTVFMQELGADFHAHNLLVTQDVQPGSEGMDIPALAQSCDWIVPMLYDQHEASSGPGPVAAIDWTRQQLKDLLQSIPASKIVMGVGNHGYDWTVGQKGAQDVTYQSAILIAKESQPDAYVHLDKSSLNPTFSYTDEAADKKGAMREEKHVVWMQDAVSVFNQLQVGKPEGIRGAALWYVGSEDPSLWSFYNKRDWNSDWKKIAEAGGLNALAYNGAGEVDFEGEGELLQPRAAPSNGERHVTLNPKTGFITGEQYQKDPVTGQMMFPSGWVVRRYGGGLGNPKKQLVLTFDDGPDPTWTPQILDILKQYHVPAVFFVVGKQAEENPGLIRREWNEGHEIGNHSWSHPDLFKLSPEAQALQLTTTQRVIQAIAGHSTLLFRPPYGGDVEPTTGAEVSPMLNAANQNYITVGEKNDPQDWRLYAYMPGTEAMDFSRPRSAQEIVTSVVSNRDEGSIVLLHDAGGPRQNTIAALPLLITQLQGMGYKFVSVSELTGFPREQLMPKVTGHDTLLVGADRYVFYVSYIFQRTLTTLFTLSILLGMSRVALFVGLALVQRVREQKRVFPVGFTPTVSVIIAAYNEEKVIARTVRALLDGDYPNLEVLVVDDGSKDGTSRVVAEAFGDESRVTLIRKENGGKASALNRGLTVATGDIMVSLDADTLFAPDTIRRLARHFADPGVGAVSGNVRVGNVSTFGAWVHSFDGKNLSPWQRFLRAAQGFLLTRWQSLEYITSQNFDRRGYDLMNCITVVPGAVGALRRSSVQNVGGYTHDTLAEDTDLTWKLRRAGWRIVNDNSAMAYTEAPESLRNLAKQRFRWAYGTLQCLWKHRAAMFRDGAFGWLALPSLWVYQILFPSISPFMDIAMLYSVIAGSFTQFLQYYLVMFGVELTAALIAVRMDRADMRLLPWLFFQRFVYRQMMYYVILKALVTAIRGGAVGWGKFERTGTARVETKAA